MTKLVTAARRAAFLKALAETGSLTLSAEQARVNKDWAWWTRKRDAGFDAACREAMAAAGVALAGARDARGMAPPKGWGTLDGVELAVRGCPGRQVQIRRARVDGWSPGVEDRFLAVLAATCNVKAACAEIRMTQASAYYHRRQWVAFAKRWDAALDEGYDRLEWGLLERAGNVFSSPDLPSAADAADFRGALGMRTDEAIHLLNMHRHRVTGQGKPVGMREHIPSMDEVEAKIVRILDAMERGRRVPEARRAADAAEWARRGGADGAATR